MAAPRSKVVWVQARPATGFLDTGSPEDLRILLEAGLRELTGCQDVASAWSRYFSSKDTIALKVNCLGGPKMCTHPALAQAVAQSLGSIRIAPEQIIVWDRSSRELDRCGFYVNTRRNDRIRCFGTDQRGAGYEEELTVQGSVGSLYSTILTRQATAAVNMPILKDHGLCGLTGALKNIFGALHNPNKYHENRCNPFIADANAVPFVREKNRLVIFDALQVQYKGGPGFHSQWVENLGGLLLAEDPVAADSVAARILDRIRGQKGLPPIEPDGSLPAYIRTAADSERKLGRCRPEEIDLVEKTVTIEKPEQSRGVS